MHVPFTHARVLTMACWMGQEAAARELAEAKGTWEARGQRQRSELREMETRLERQEQAHQRAAASLQHDMSALQERLTSSQACGPTDWNDRLPSAGERKAWQCPGNGSWCLELSDGGATAELAGHQCSHNNAAWIAAAGLSNAASGSM